MQSRSNMASASPAAATNTRFELPALDLKLGSLTDGTDIPPPLPSPMKETAAPTPPDTPDPEKQEAEGTEATSGKPGTPSHLPTMSTAGTKRRAEDNPASPTLSTRPGSIRRLFSRGLLNTAYANGTVTSSDGRPQSRSGSSVAESRKTKRSSGWFGRLCSTDEVANKAAGPLSPPATDETKPKGSTGPTGPPPPMIPELSELNSGLGIQNDSGFGGDLFNNIK